MLLTKEEQSRVDAKIIEMYNGNYTLTEMSIEIGRSSKHIGNRVRVLKQMGKLPDGRKKRIVKNPIASVPTRERHSGEGKTTLADGETVRCTAEVSRTCIYGVAKTDPNSMDLCHYCLITGHSRKCPHSACTKYGKISSDNPRREFGSRVGKC